MIGERLRLLRKQAGETQTEVAQVCGIHPVAYNRYETGARTPDPDYLLKLARHFDVSVDYLLDNEPPETMTVPMDDFDLLCQTLSAEEKEALTAVLRCIRQASGK